MLTKRQQRRDFERQTGNAFLLILIAVALIWFFGFVKDAVSATPTPGVPIGLEVNSDSVPGSLKLGSTVKVTITVTAFASFKKMQVGLEIPGNVPVLSPTKRLIRPVADAGPIWDVGGMQKGTKPKVLTFRIKVANPPKDAAGEVPWCVSATATPSLLTGPPAWLKTDVLCYGVSLP